MQLEHVYRHTLERCAPDVLVQARVDRSLPRDVVAIGKCAGALLDGVAAVHDIAHAFVAARPTAAKIATSHETRVIVHDPT